MKRKYDFISFHAGGYLQDTNHKDNMATNMRLQSVPDWHGFQLLRFY